jgi:F-type H+-transporting ATPase subunit gamma
MSRRREVLQHLVALKDIDGIMVAMKNLALLETNRLAKFLDTQRRVVKSMDMAASDFLHFYPQAPAQGRRLLTLLVTIGSERGLCGDFNESLLEPLRAATGQSETIVVLVGSRLTAKVSQDSRVTAFVEGPSVGGEIHAALMRLVKVLGEVQQRQPERAWCINALYHDHQSEKVGLRRLLPIQETVDAPVRSHAPLLNLQPRQFFSELTDQYLFAVLHEIFYSSLMVENRMRLEHMDRAIRRMERDQETLRLRYNRLRQEEIIEEIEIIMLSAEAVSGPM